jgi:tetratricopeptide (TPR) repeat protein
MSYIALYKPGSTHPKDKEYETKGIAAFEKLLTLKAPDADQADKVKKYYLAFLDSSGQQDKAIAFLEQELAKQPENKELISTLAGMYQKKGDVQNWLRYLDRRAQLEPTNKEAWYSIAVACWARSYHGGMTVAQEEREQVVARGLEAADKALALDKDYLDAITYKNLLYREQAKAFANVGKSMEAGEAIMKAEELRNQALELRKKQQAQAPAKGKA